MKTSPIANSTRFAILDEGAMSAEQLKRNLDAGDLVHANADSATLVSIRRAVHPATGSEVYAMWGPTGTHCLAVESTDAGRLHAHWTGYVENARRR